MLRIAVALGLALALPALTAVDPWLCPDGCASEPIDERSPSGGADSGCILCLGFGEAARALSYARVSLVAAYEPGATANPETMDPRPIDHPPRSA